MTEKYQNKYRIKSARLQNWDYGWNGLYFITICTKNRKYFFGDIVDGKMNLSETGEKAEKYWLAIPEYFPFIKLGNHVIMPNHVHGIIIIDKPNTCNSKNAISSASAGGKNAINRVFTTGGITGYNNPMLYDNLSRAVRWYKGRTSFESRKTKPHFAWQPRFHDHIIRNQRSHQNISNYIINNPLKWDADKFIKRRD